ncbi:GntP family permease [Motilibacter deserti]|uniref:Gluconate transporter n=1 Tax=Motilibacter deserti TaxID=2714956 RepID=A0ABX0GVI1_9ACTN|nr:SLC13 family permease [Motilibacter deserti]NHC14938.1 gluconate transporter [Motilibacter deserti]
MVPAALGAAVQQTQLLAADGDVQTSASDSRLVIAALVGIAVIVVLITVVKLHPFLSLTLGSGVLALAAGIPFADTFASFTSGLGSTVSGVGVLIALGAIIGKLLTDSGGADEIVDTILARTSTARLPWAMALIAFVIGIPLFFEVGVVLIIPVVMLVARRAQQSLIRVGMPAIAGLSVLHGLVPPHPGPLIAIDALDANLGLTLGLGLLVAVPTLIVSGPLLVPVMERWVQLPPPPALAGAAGAGTRPTRERETALARGGRGEDDLVTPRDISGNPAATPGGSSGSSGPSGGGGTGAAGVTGAGAAREAGSTVTAEDAAEPAPGRRPSFGVTLFTILLPVVLMLGRTLAESVLDEDTRLRTSLEFIGSPLVALLATALVALVTLGVTIGRDRSTLSRAVDSSFTGIASILLIVGAGGGFKQTLVDSGVADVVARAAEDTSLSPLVTGWLIAVLIRLATGSATVATITAAGIVAPLAADLSDTHAALLALAVGAGSLFLSHVNDAGFWLIKEYFGMTVGQTFKTWSFLECVISTVALVVILLLSLVL